MLMALILSECRVSGDNLYPMFYIRFVYHMISVVLEASAQYSTLAIDCMTVGCFLAPQDSKLSPRKITNPMVDLRSSFDPAQSASQNACKVVANVFVSRSPQI